jgi:hypothetical protein
MAKQKSVKSKIHLFNDAFQSRPKISLIYSKSIEQFARHDELTFFVDGLLIDGRFIDRLLIDRRLVDRFLIDRRRFLERRGTDLDVSGQDVAEVSSDQDLRQSGLRHQVFQTVRHLDESVVFLKNRKTILFSSNVRIP